MGADDGDTSDDPRRYEVFPTTDRTFSKEYIAQLNPATLAREFPDTCEGEFLLIRNEVVLSAAFREADAEAGEVPLETVPETVVTELHTPIHTNEQPAEDEIGLDFTLRTALGAPAQLEVEHGESADGTPVEIAEVAAEPFENPEDRIERRMLNAALGVRPTVCRVRMGVFPDLEDKVCRLPENTMDLLGVEEGENVVVESTKGEQIVRGIKAFEITEERREIKDTQKQRDRNRYPPCEALLGLQQIRQTEVDIPEIWIDEEVRIELGLQDRYKCGVCQPVRVYRDTKFLLEQKLHQFAIPLVIVLIAAGLEFFDTFGLLAAALIWLFAILIWVLATILVSRGRLS